MSIEEETRIAFERAKVLAAKVDKATKRLPKNEAMRARRAAVSMVTNLAMALACLEKKKGSGGQV